MNLYVREHMLMWTTIYKFQLHCLTYILLTYNLLTCFVLACNYETYLLLMGVSFATKFTSEMVLIFEPVYRESLFIYLHRRVILCALFTLVMVSNHSANFKVN